MKIYLQLLLFCSFFTINNAFAEAYHLKHPYWEDVLEQKGDKFCRSNNDCALIKAVGDKKLVVQWENYPVENFLLSENKKYWLLEQESRFIQEEYDQFVYSFEEPFVKLNPYKITPLSAILKFPTEEKSKISIRIKGKNGDPDITHEFKGYYDEHELEIHGLYPNFDNKVILNAYNEKGTLKISEIIISTGDTGIFKQMIPILKKDKKFHYYASTAGQVFDERGNLRYVFSIKGWKLAYFRNNFVYVEHKNGVYKYSMMGKLLREYEYPENFYGYMHGMGFKDNGNLLVFGTFNGSKAVVDGVLDETHRDFVLEIDKENGNVVSKYDLAEMLNPDRSLIVKSGNHDYGKVDWAHTNGIDYNSEDKSVIVSGRHFGMVKIDEKTKKPIWWMTPHQLTDKSGRKGDKGDISHLLLTAIDKNGKAYSKNVQKGNEKVSGFKWPLKTHSVRYIGNDVYAIFDNSGKMYDKKLYTTANSYASVFKINDKKKTVQQIFLKELPVYSEVGSIVVVHPKTRDVFVFASQVATANSKRLYNGELYRFTKDGDLVYKAILNRRDNAWDYLIEPYEFYK